MKLTIHEYKVYIRGWLIKVNSFLTWVKPHRKWIFLVLLVALAGAVAYRCTRPAPEAPPPKPPSPVTNAWLDWYPKWVPANIQEAKKVQGPYNTAWTAFWPNEMDGTPVSNTMVWTSRQYPIVDGETNWFFRVSVSTNGYPSARLNLTWSYPTNDIGLVSFMINYRTNGIGYNVYGYHVPKEKTYFTVPGLRWDTIYYFNVTALNTNNLQSLPSNELMVDTHFKPPVIKIIPAQ